MKNTFKKWRRAFRAKLIPILFSIISKLSFNILYKLAKLLAFMSGIFPSKTVRIAQRNIELCFPNLSISEKKVFLKKILFHNIASVLEFARIWGADLKDNMRYVTIKNAQAEEIIKKNPTGMILITPHFGAWELSGQYCSACYQTTIMYRPSRLGLDELLLSSRKSAGAIPVPANQTGVKAMMKALKQGKVIGILPDQDPGLGDGEFAPFFGINAKTMTFVSRLAQKYKVPVYLLTSLRIMENNKATGRFEITYTLLEDDIYAEDILVSLTCLNQAIEKIIRQAPEQYLWTYPRFKSTPEGETPRY